MIDTGDGRTNSSSATSEETVPIVANEQEQQLQPNRQAVCRSLLPLLFIFTLERCSYYEYMSTVINARNSSYSYCGVLEGQDLTDTWWTAVSLQLPQCVSFLLPLLGGFVADQFCGCTRALRIGCVLYHLGAWVLLLLVHWGPACSTWLVITCEAVLVSAAGLLRPSLLVLTIESGRPLMGPRQLCQLYYLWEAVGQVLGYLLAFASDLLRVPLAGACVPTTLLMLLLTIGIRERRGWNSRQYFLPSWPRFVAYTWHIVVVATPLVLVAFGVLMGYFTLGVWDLKEAEVLTDPLAVRRARDVLLLCYSVALVAAVLVLMLMTRTLSLLRPPDVRIAVGIAAVAVGHFAAFSLINLEWSLPFNCLLASYGCLNVTYAVAEAFAITTANEIAFRIAPEEMRTFMIGLFMGFWGSGYCFGTLVEVSGLRSMYAHLLLGALLVATFPYLFCCTVRSLRWLLTAQSLPDAYEDD